MAIYKITNKLNGMIYIGQTIKKDPFQRIKFHFKNYSSNHGYIHRAIQKYGSENFSILILEDTINPDELNLLEKYYIDYYNCIAPNGYNYTSGGDSNVIKAESTILKLREAGLKHPYMKKGMTAWNKGIPFSKESRQKMSEAKKGKKPSNFGKKLNRYKPIIDDNGIIYRNPDEAAFILNVKANTIIKACTDKKQIRRVKGKLLTYL